MKNILLLILKILITLVIAVALVWLSFEFNDYLIELFNIRFDLASKIDKRAAYKKFGDLYNHLVYFGLALACGIIIVLLLWNKQESRKKRNWIYVILLIVLIPFSVINYWSEDIFFDRWQQAIIDLIICFFGVMILLNTLRFNPKSDELRVFKWVAVFFLASQAIFIPGIYALIWFFNFQGLIAKADTEGFNPNWITYLSSTGGLIVSILNYRLQKKSKKSVQAEK